MATKSVDTFAHSNPAFCALVLRTFVEGYQKSDARGVLLPLMLLPLPVILSNDLASTFDGTNSRTGLITWIGRNPELIVSLPHYVDGSAQLSREALLFAVTYKVLGLNKNGRIVTDETGLRRKVRTRASDPKGKAFLHSRTFGKWLGDTGSLETIFACLGINL